MDRHAIALILEEIATLLEAGGGDRFRARAFRTAARAVDKLDVEPAALLDAGALLDVPGIGPATARVIEELVRHGESSYHDELRRRAPSGLRDLLLVPGLGPHRIARLHTELGIRDLDSLEAAAKSGGIAALSGFGPRTQQRILEGIAFARGAGRRRRRFQVQEAAERLRGFIAELDGISRAELAGELRRCLETVDAIEIVAASDTPADAILHGLRALPGIDWAIAPDGVLEGRLGDGFPLRVRIAVPASFGAALLAATGSARHLERVRALAAERGLRLDGHALLRGDEQLHVPDEAAVYGALDLPYIPPELRERGDEVDMARTGALPRLIEDDDLRGCFHCHTTHSDGRSSVHEMAEAALSMGWRYLGIADHSRSAGYARGLAPRQLRTQRREIDAWNRARGDELWLFAGVEADIMVDGAIDYAAQGDVAVLDALDFVVASVHSAFSMPRDDMTRRVIRALDDPHVTMLGHATGRLLLTRDGYQIDIDAVIERAAAVGASIEINADPHRLDLSWQHWPRAVELGVPAAINPDAHSAAALENVFWGVDVARKAGLDPERVINAWPIEDVREFLQSRKVRS